MQKDLKDSCHIFKMSNTTRLENLKNVETQIQITDNIICDKDKKTLSDLIIDLSHNLDRRINALEIYFKQFGQEESNELINRLSTMYTMSGTKILEQYLHF